MHNIAFFKGIKLKYSNNEIISNVDSIIHPIYKEALNYFDFDTESQYGIELVSTASIPSGNGLGSSAAFTTSLMQCLGKHFHNQKYEKKHLLQISTNIEKKSGNNNIGFQDQISSIYGSFSSTKYTQDSIEVNYPSDEWQFGMKRLIESKGFLIKTEARQGLSSSFIENASLEKNINTYENLLTLAEEIDTSKPIFEEEKIINVLTESSLISKVTKTRTKLIDELEDVLKNNGAIYTKQLGAGGGGFMFCLFKDPFQKFPIELQKYMLKPTINMSGLKIY